MKNNNDFLLLLYLCTAFATAYSYQFINCSSNQIHEISQNGKKALIRYDDTKRIKLNENGQNVKIWCEANQPIQKCILLQLGSGSRYEKVCDYEYPIRCSSQQTSSCKNKRILYEQANENKCVFIFDSLKKTGKLSKKILLCLTNMNIK